MGSGVTSLYTVTYCYLENGMWGWRGVSAVKSPCCSCGGPEFNSHHLHVAHSHPQLQFQGVGYPCLTSKGTSHIHEINMAWVGVQGQKTTGTRHIEHQVREHQLAAHLTSRRSAFNHQGWLLVSVVLPAVSDHNSSWYQGNIVLCNL